MYKLKIKDNVNLDDLIKYGFEKYNRIVDYHIYVYRLEDTLQYKSSILVNTAEHNDRILRFYYYDDLDDKVTYEEWEDGGGFTAPEINPVDYVIPIPEVIFKLIQDNIVEIY